MKNERNFIKYKYTDNVFFFFFLINNTKCTEIKLYLK